MVSITSEIYVFSLSFPESDTIQVEKLKPATINYYLVNYINSNV